VRVLFKLRRNSLSRKLKVWVAMGLAASHSYIVVGPMLGCELNTLGGSEAVGGV